MTAESDAPLIDDAGNSYVSDNNYLVSFSPGGRTRWRVPNPAGVALLSFNLTADGDLVGQGSSGTVVVADPRTGVTHTLLLQDTIAGMHGIFLTRNTVSVRGNRLYTVTQFCPDAMLRCWPRCPWMKFGLLAMYLSM